MHACMNGEWGIGAVRFLRIRRDLKIIRRACGQENGAGDARANALDSLWVASLKRTVLKNRRRWLESQGHRKLELSRQENGESERC